MALACDIRIAVQGAKVFYPVMKLGYMPQPSDPRRMAALIGPARTKMILMAGQKITTDEALAYGLIDRIVDADVLMDHAHDLIADSAAADPTLVAGIRGLIHHD
jgi:enoyl-CoA hydratase/carnithine racemase